MYTYKITMDMYPDPNGERPTLDIDFFDDNNMPIKSLFSRFNVEKIKLLKTADTYIIFIVIVKKPLTERDIIYCEQQLFEHYREDTKLFYIGDKFQIKNIRVELEENGKI